MKFPACDGYRLGTSQPKSKKSRRVDMPPEVAEAIKELPSRFARGLVFCQDNARPLDPDNLLKRDFARVLRGAKVLASASTTCATLMRPC